MRVLLVDDEIRLTDTLSTALKAEGLVVVCANSGVEGLYEATHNSFDVVILDIMLPGYSGYEVLRRMRTRGIWTPVLMLTAKDGEYDQTDAFDLGADDYLTKPFSFRVLVARLRALARRRAPERPAILSVGALSLDPARRTVHRGSTLIELTPREFELLEYLLRNKDIVVTKAAILHSVWDTHYQGADNVVQVYMRYLRNKIDVPFGTNTIETVRGVGYRLLPAILTAGSLTVNLEKRTVQRGSTAISLSPREYAVLEYLMRNKGAVVSRSDILRRVWDAGDDGPENVVEVYVGYVRRKIDTPFGTKTIETIRGAGYLLVG
jgi:two-component system, OmpR family, response regulator